MYMVEETLWKVSFINYPYETFVTKYQIINGCVNNPEIDKFDFVNKKFLQNCGDTLIVLNKSSCPRGSTISVSKPKVRRI